MRGERTPAGPLAVLLVAVLASGIAAAAMHGSDHANRPTAATTTAGSAPTTVAAPAPPVTQTAVATRSATVSAGKAAAPAHPAPGRKAPARGSGKLPYTGPSPVGPSVGVAVLLLALGAWSVGAPRPLWMAQMSAIDRLRARGRYRTAR